MKYKLLVAEDDPLERSALCKTLNTHLRKCLSILEAASGSQALELFYSQSPQIVILNIELPDLSGLDVARQIREHSKTCVLLFISDQDDFSYAKQAISLRAMEYIMKPLDGKKLIAAVEEAIQYCSHMQDLSAKSLQPDILQSHKIPEGTRLALIREEISSYIESHYMDELSMKTVAHVMNYSDAYFCKLFKLCFLTNFSTYLNQYRIQKAKVMMEDSRASVKEIGIACGYTDANYFARIFKRIIGMTPSEYRIYISQNR